MRKINPQKWRTNCKLQTDVLWVVPAVKVAGEDSFLITDSRLTICVLTFAVCYEKSHPSDEPRFARFDRC